MEGSGMGDYGREGTDDQGIYGSVGRMGIGNNHNGGYGTQDGLGGYGHGDGGNGGYYGQGGTSGSGWHRTYQSTAINIKVLTTASSLLEFLTDLISFVF